MELYFCTRSMNDSSTVVRLMDFCQKVSIENCDVSNKMELVRIWAAADIPEIFPDLMDLFDFVLWMYLLYERMLIDWFRPSSVYAAAAHIQRWDWLIAFVRHTIGSKRSTSINRRFSQSFRVEFHWCMWITRWLYIDLLTDLLTLRDIKWNRAVSKHLV